MNVCYKKTKFFLEYFSKPIKIQNILWFVILVQIFVVEFSLLR